MFPLSAGFFVFGVNVVNPAVLILDIVLSAICFAAMDSLLSTPPSETPAKIMLLSNVGRLPLIFVSGVFIPIEKMPGWGSVGLAFVGLFALIFGFLVKWIWNMLMPGLFGLSEITFWQAFGIIILAKLIFGGFGPHRRDHWHRDRRLPHDWAPPWRRFADKRGTFKSKYNKWKYCQQYWRDEGKAAFEGYVDRIQKEKRETGEK